MSFLISVWVGVLLAAGGVSSHVATERLVLPDSLEMFTVASQVLGETRVINVSLPPGYHAPRGGDYPVLYLLDGGLEEDFRHIAVTIDSLMALGAIRPVIVVGIENTERRRDLTGPTAVASDSAIAPRVGGSAMFRRFLADELMPAVRQRYRTNGETTLAGESLAGLFVVETFLLEPTMFHGYIAISPSLWWNGAELLRSARGLIPATAGRVLYLTAANEPGIASETATLAATLRAAAPASLTWYYRPRPDLDHSTILRRAGPAAFATVLR